MIKQRNLIVCLMFILACSNPPKQEFADQEVDAETKVSLQLRDSVQFELDTLTPSTSYCIRYIKLDSGGILAYQNKMLNNIVLFDWESKKVIHTLHFEKEGPEGIGKLYGFDILNKDSLVLSGHMRPYLHFYDLAGERLGKVELAPTDQGRAMEALIEIGLPYVTEGSAAILPLFPLGDWSQVEDFTKESVGVKTDLLTGKSTTLNVTFPEDYFRDGQLTFSRIRMGKKLFAYSFTNDHDLYLTTDHLTFTKKKMRSQYVSDFIPLEPDLTMELYLSWLTQCPQYLMLLRDPYRHLVYRFVSLGDKDYDQDRLSESSRYHQNLSIMILDEKLNFLGEYRLPKGHYYWRNSFVTERGLYISKNSPFNNDYQSEALSFDLFEVEQL